MQDSTTRFSSRVEDYVKYRPHYPSGIGGLLAEKAGLQAGAVIADVGSGTGIFSKLLLECGYRVIGVEPNKDMRGAAEEYLAGYELFESVNGQAEATTLPDGSVEAVTVAQALHWFDLEKTRAEFQRILKPGGMAIAVWNARLFDTSPFLIDYEKMLERYGVGYANVNHRGIGLDDMAVFYGNNHFQLETFPNDQKLDFDGIKGRLLSSSYTPEAGHPDHEPMLTRLREIFEAHQEGGRVVVEYSTNVYYGPLP